MSGRDACLQLLIVAFGGGVARAQSAPELTAADVANEPAPGHESGRIDDTADHESVLRLLGRDALFLPRLAYDGAIAPIRGLVWADDRYDLQGMYYRAFFNADRTIGLFPTAAYTAGFGAVAGMRLEATDLLGAHEGVALQALTGAITLDTYRASLLAAAHTGDRLGRHLRLGVEASFDRRPADPFYGIGNGDEIGATTMPIDPLHDATAVETYNRYQQVRTGVSADLHEGALHVEGTGALYAISYAPSTTGTPIEQVYDPSDLVGFTRGVEQAYGELAVRWDTRHRASSWEPSDEHAGGSLAAGFLGRIDRVDGGADFFRYGVELQHYWRLAQGPRTLMVRFHGEGVTGPLDQVPFTELPMLGGGTYLRGYDYERFRDRVAALGTIQYAWDVSHYADVYLFSDVGRVYDSLDSLSARDLRVGYGIGTRLRGQNGFLLEATLASSIDGGVFVGASFNPLLDTETRWR